MELWKKIVRWAERSPGKTALSVDGAGALTYSELRGSVASCARRLAALRDKRVGILISNRPLWAVYDMALTLKGATVVPIPLFFSEEQAGHIVRDANLDCVVVEPGINFPGLHRVRIIEADPAFERPVEATERERDIGPQTMPSGIAKIIYTSGTTGNPKGVMVTLRAIETVTESLRERTRAASDDVHLSLLPLSTLVEAIGGLYVPLAAGATVVYPEAGDTRSPASDTAQSVKTLFKVRPTTLNLVPALLEGIVGAAEKNGGLPETLRFVACGGAPLGSTLIERAYFLGIPLYQGYGLSECVTAVSLNSPDNNHPRSSGLPLRHVHVTVAQDGEIIVSGDALMSGYLNEEGNKKICAWKTGDVGYMDEEGYLYVTGRKDSVFATAYGRNISPEWIEEELVSSRAIRQAVVYGDGRPFLTAVIVPDYGWLREVAGGVPAGADRERLLDHPRITETVSEEVASATSNLPGYAAIKAFVLAREAFSPENGLMTPDGRPRRDRILAAYRDRLNGLYENHTKKKKEEDEYVIN